MPVEEISVKVSAPGKVILHGEHSVVYGKLAIAASLDLRTTVALQEKRNHKFEINFVDLKLKKKFNIEDLRSVFRSQTFPLTENKLQFNFERPDLLDHNEYIKILEKSLNLEPENLQKNQYLSLISFFYMYFGIIQSSKIPLEPLTINVKTELSIGSGTGSSASLMVSLAGALLRYLTLKAPHLKHEPETHEILSAERNLLGFNEVELNLISKWAFAAEKIIHGNPSGIDNTVCTYGSMVSFRKGRAPFAVKCRDDIKGLLVDTKVPKNTALLVKKVADLRMRRANIVDSIFDAMEQITDDALENLVRLGELKNNDQEKIKHCYDNLMELTDMNHNLLRTLGVSHTALDDIIQIMNKKNLHGKLTGAGGGGYAICLIPPNLSSEDIHDTCNQITAHGYLPSVTKLGGNGVRVEEDSTKH